MTLDLKAKNKTITSVKLAVDLAYIKTIVYSFYK